MAILPTLLSTSVGNSLISKILTEITSSPCYLEGQFSYFQPQKITQLHLAFNDFELKLYDVTIDQLSGMIFNKKKALVSINNFSLSPQKLTTAITPIAADVSPKFPIKPWGIYCNVTIADGTYFDNTHTPSITHITGNLFYSSSIPIDIHIEGVCDHNGFIKLKGQYDTKSKNIDGDITLKNCPSSLIPTSFITPLLGQDFNLYLTFNGSLKQGHALYQFDSADLSISGQCDINKKHLIIKDTNKLLIKRTLPYIYKDLVIKDLRGQIVLNSLDLTLGSFPEIKSIFCTYEGSTQAISYQNQPSGPFQIIGHLSQEHDDVVAEATLTQNTNTLLTCSACYSVNEAILKKGFINATNIPLIFPIQWQNFSVGHFLNIKADFSTKEGLITGSWSSSSPHIKSLNSLFSCDKTSLSLDTLTLNYDDGVSRFNLEAAHLQTPFHDIPKITGMLQADIFSYPHIDQRHFPLNGTMTFKGLDYIATSIKAPYLNLHGIGSFNIPSSNFILKDSWQGVINFDTKTIDLPFAKTPLIGTIAIPSGSKLSLLPVKVTLDPFSLNSQKDIVVKDAIFDIDLNALSLDIALKANATFYQQEASNGQIQASCQISNKVLQTAHITLKNPPLEALSGLNQEIAKAAQFFGKNLILDFKLLEQGQNIDLEASSENLKLKGAFGFKDHIFLIKPIKGSLRIKTLDLPFLSSQYPFKLKKPFDLNLQIEALDIPLSNLLIEDIAVNGSVNILNLSLEQNKKMLQMEAFTASFAKSKGHLPLNCKIEADVFSSYDKVVTSGSLNGSCSILSLIHI